MTTAAIPRIRRVRPCLAFKGVNRCRTCLWNKHFHQPRFQFPRLAFVVGCSQCGGEIRRDTNEGYSHCSDHETRGEVMEMKLLDLKAPNTAFKCVRSTGKDFYADKYMHEVGGVVTEPECAPAEFGLCGPGLHVSETLRQAIHCSRQAENATRCYPWRFFRVHVEPADVIRVGSDKMRVRSYRVEQEYTMEDIFGADLFANIEASKEDIATWKEIPWFNPSREITADDIRPLLAEWVEALIPYHAKRGLNRDPPRKSLIITDRVVAIQAAKSWAAAADAAAAAAEAADAAAADANADAAAAANAAAAADAAAAAADAADAAAAAAALWPYWANWNLRPRYALWRSWRWRVLGITGTNPWEPIVKMYRLGVAPIGYRHVNGEVVFVVYAPKVNQ
jgi:hypothetical protein